MSIISEKQLRLVIVGATGMVGGYALRYALENPIVGHVTTIGRKKLGISHPKLKEVVHRDFADCSALADELSGQNAAVFCLGTYTGAVPDKDLRTITVDYTVEFARVFRGSSPDAAFSFLSGSGADPTGRSRMTPFRASSLANARARAASLRRRMRPQRSNSQNVFSEIKALLAVTPLLGVRAKKVVFASAYRAVIFQVWKKLRPCLHCQSPLLLQLSLSIPISWLFFTTRKMRDATRPG